MPKDMVVTKIVICDNCGDVHVDGVNFLDGHGCIAYSACKNCLKTALGKMKNKDLDMHL